MNSVGFNLARAVGPALGGFVVGILNPGAAFMLNAISFVGVMIVLYLWPRTPELTGATPESIGFGEPLVGNCLCRHGKSDRGCRADQAIDGVAGDADLGERARVSEPQAL